MRLYCKDSIVAVCGLLRTLINTLLDIANNNVQFIMPGYTHLQKAAAHLRSRSMSTRTAKCSCAT